MLSIIQVCTIKSSKIKNSVKIFDFQKRLKKKNDAKFAKRRARSLSGQSDRHALAHGARGRRAKPKPFSRGPAIDRGPSLGSDIGRSRSQKPRRSRPSQSRSFDNLSFSYARSFASDNSAEFSSSVTASTRSSLARAGIYKYGHCNSHPCSPTELSERRRPTSGTPGLNLMLLGANSGTSYATENYSGAYSSFEGRGYVRTRPSGTEKYERSRRQRPVGTTECPGPKSPWFETRSRVNFDPVVDVKKRSVGSPPDADGKGRDRKPGRKSDIKVVLDVYTPPPRVIPKGLKKMKKEGKMSRKKTPSPPKGKKYTDIRVSPCDVIKKSSLTGEKEQYKYFRKDGEETEAWKASVMKEGIYAREESKSRKKRKSKDRKTRRFKASKGSKAGNDEEKDESSELNSVSEAGDSQITEGGGSESHGDSDDGLDMSEGGESDFEEDGEWGSEGRESADEALLQVLFVSSFFICFVSMKFSSNICGYCPNFFRHQKLHVDNPNTQEVSYPFKFPRAS